jgi:hypothetical protein
LYNVCIEKKVLSLIFNACHYLCIAGVMELVDMTDSKSVAFGRGGSSPPTGTKHKYDD